MCVSVCIYLATRVPSLSLSLSLGGLWMDGCYKLSYLTCNVQVYIHTRNGEVKACMVMYMYVPVQLQQL